MPLWGPTVPPSCQINLEVHQGLTGQLADKPTRGQSTRGLDYSRTSQLADSEFKKNVELLYFICTLNLTLTITLTLSNIDSVYMA